MDKDKLKKYIWNAALVLAVILLAITYVFLLYRDASIMSWFSKVVDILTPLILGAVIAYIMKSTCNFYEKFLLKGLLRSGKREKKKAEKIANGLSVAFAYITWIAAITLLLWIAVPQIIESITTFVNEMVVKIPEYIKLLLEWEENFLADHPDLRPYFDQVVDWALDWANTELLPQLQSFLSTTLLPGVFGLVGSLVDIAIGLVISVFILLGRKTLAKKSMLLLHCLFKKEKTVRAIADEFKYADKMFSGFLEGKVIDSTIIGLLYYIVLEIMNVPYAPLVAVICGVTNIIPIFGPFIGAIPSGLIILTANPMKVIPFIIFVFVVQFIDGYIIDPHIVGGNIKLSSFCVVFAVILFGGLWGFTGLLIGVPTFAVIYDIVKKVCTHVLKKRGKYDLLVQFYNDAGGKKKKKNAANADAAAAVTADTDAIVEAVAESVSATVAESVSATIAETVAEAVAEAVASSVAEQVTEAVTETVAEQVNEAVNEAVSEAITESVAISEETSAAEGNDTSEKNTKNN